MSIAGQSITVWLTGLPSAGKTTLAKLLSERLEEEGIDHHLLDGDEVRTHLCNDLGFSRKDRDENVRRVGFVANLLSLHGTLTICPVISPYREARDQVRELHDGRFVEVYVATPVEVCEERDVKGLYAKARSGEISQMTGIDDPYEPPLDPDVVVPTHELSREESVELIWDAIKSRLSPL